ncbi:OprO/OprP family phosphate-selective porin [Methylophaga lonarensis]|uniref:OprO/OprP family phosphate-selective porin n=1 Tax=Methylophaga lonarensis TaxID=999151 RepID=UPI003D2D7A10
MSFITRTFICLLLLSANPLLAEESAKTAKCPLPLCYQSADSQFAWQLGTRLQLDAGWFDNDRHSDFSDGTNVRRARLNAKVDFGEYWMMELTYDFARDGRSAIRDAILRYRNDNGYRFTLGHFKEPFGLERLTSVRDLAFMERSLSSLLSPTRAFGVELHHHSRHHTRAVGIFRTGTETGFADSRYGITARATFAPHSDDGDIQHFGLAVAYRNNASSGEMRLRQRPETRISETRLIDTGNFFARDYWLFGLEKAIAIDSLAVQAEVNYLLVPDARLNQQPGKHTLGFYGWHVDLSWILTGEPQPYNHEKGTFGRLKPARNIEHGGPGAFRIGLRLSSLDLSNRHVSGGHQHNATLGLSWILNPNISVLTEYVKVLRVSGNDQRGAEPALVQARLQLVY